MIVYKGQTLRHLLIINRIHILNFELLLDLP